MLDRNKQSFVQNEIETPLNFHVEACLQILGSTTFVKK